MKILRQEDVVERIEICDDVQVSRLGENCERKKVRASDNANHPDHKVKYYIRKIAHYVRFCLEEATGIVPFLLMIEDESRRCMSMVHSKTTIESEPKSLSL